MAFRNSSTTASKPTGVAAGDLLLCFLAVSDGSSVVSALTPPSGWSTGYTNYGSYGCFGFYYKYATSSEPSSYAFTWTGLSEGITVIGYRSASTVATSNPVDTCAYQEFSSAAGVFTTPGISTAVANELLHVVCFARSSSTRWTLPTSPAETAFGNSPRAFQAADGHGVNICAGIDVIASPGSVSGRTATNSNNPNYGGAFILALKPNSGGTNYTRTAACGIGASPSTTRHAGFHRSISLTVNSAPTSSRMAHLHKVASSGVGASASPGRIAHLKRAITAACSSTVTAGRLFHGIRAASASILSAATATRFKAYVFQCLAGIRAAASSARRYHANRAASAGLGASSSISSTFTHIMRAIRNKFNRLFGIGIGP